MVTVTKIVFVFLNPRVKVRNFREKNKKGAIFVCHVLKVRNKKSRYVSHGNRIQLVQVSHLVKNTNNY